jgi:endonuclease YncB( thermonuclease family)
MTLTLTLLLAAAQASQPILPIYGTAVAGDGDSLSIGNQRFRLFGIDAPELDQTCSRDGQQWPCGAEAKAQLAKLVAGKQVRCTKVGVDQHERIVAQCITRDVDLNRAMVESGFAVAFRKYSADHVDAEARAKGGNLGLWSGTFKLPEEHRAGSTAHRRSTKAARASVPKARPVAGRSEVSDARWHARTSGRCVIKGNHSRRGEWIYHLPGMRYYAQTRPEEIFCTEAEAQAAGYRRAIVR